jgi:hypothetical protein
MLRVPAVCFALLLVSPAGTAPVGPGAPADPVEFAGPPGSGKPNLAVTRSGQAVLTWHEPAGGDRHALRFSVRTGRSWSAPATIRESDRFFVNWADFPSLIETGSGLWVVHWLEKTEARPYAYHVMLSVSRDRGRTWSDPVRAHTDASPTEHGFVAMVPDPAGGADLMWLDGRHMEGEHRGAMTVRTVPMDRDGRLGAEVEVDPRVCECCQVAMTRSAAGLIAAYRDRSDSEVRDIAVVRQVNGRWTAPSVIAPDGWEIRACPVNGPALAADGHDVALAWYTSAGAEARVYAVLSDDGGATFGPRIRLDLGNTMGRVHVAALGQGAFAAAWLDRQGAGDAVWRVRRIERGGRLGPARTVASVSAVRLAGFPRLARAGDDLLLGVTATGDEGGVRLYRLAGLERPRS